MGHSGSIDICLWVCGGFVTLFASEESLSVDRSDEGNKQRRSGLQVRVLITSPVLVVLSSVPALRLSIRLSH